MSAIVMQSSIGGKASRPENMMSDDSSRPLDQLEATILSRQANPDEKSYTAKLLAGGVPKIAKKILEEAGELVEAAGEPAEEGRQHTICEAGDLLYHTLVLLASRGVRLAEVETELARRFGVSGLEEKASRTQK